MIRNTSKKMAVDTNWKTFLSPDSSLPPDVTFLVKGEGEEEVKVPAHRFLLAATSSVFNRQFYGPMKDIREVIEVKDTTPEAFMTMMNYIYKDPGEESFNLNDIDCPQKLFELVELAERYEIPNLKEIASKALETLDISQENMIFTATVAKNYKETFADLSNKVLTNCLDFLFLGPSSAGNILGLFMETKKSFPEADFNIFNELISVGSERLKVPGMYLKIVIIHYFAFCAGWEHVRYFDLGRYNLETGEPISAEIHKLGPEWKVTYEVLARDHPTEEVEGLSVRFERIGLDDLTYALTFCNENLRLWEYVMHDQVVLFNIMRAETSQLPPTGKWTKIEMTQEKEADKYFISVSLEGVQVMSREVLFEGSQDPATSPDATVTFNPIANQPPASIRNLVVLEK